jgi:hypothetical protein
MSLLLIHPEFSLRYRYWQPVYFENSPTLTQETKWTDWCVYCRWCLYDPRARAKRGLSNMKAGTKGKRCIHAPEFCRQPFLNDTRITNFDIWLPDAMKESSIGSGRRCRHVRRGYGVMRQHAARSAALQEGGLSSTSPYDAKFIKGVTDSHSCLERKVLGTGQI